MKDQLHGTIDLQAFLARDGARPWQETVALRGPSHASDDEGACVVLGHPEIDGQRPDAPAATLLAGWRRDGSKLLARLSGDYAFAIVDAAQRHVVLAVDRFAIQTLCLRHENGRLSFSDRADCVDGRSGELDPQAIYDYLYFHMVPAPRTVFRDVRRLPAGHAFTADAAGTREERHWTLRFDEKNRPGFEAARAEFRGLVRGAVERQLHGHERIGAFLSGGTDSSTVAGMLGQITGKPAPTYSIGFEADGYDEMEYARLAARHFGCEHHEYYVTPADLLASIPAIAQHHDQPFGNSSALPAYYCAKMAREDGCTKLLAGDGGDELFGGNSRYAMQTFLEYYHGVPKGLRGLIEPLCGDGSILRKIPGLRQMTGYVRHARVEMPARMQNMNLLIELKPEQLLTPSFLAGVDRGEPDRHMAATWRDCESGTVLNRMLAYDWRYTLADSDLPKVRGATGMAGMAVGYPMLDDALVDFSMRLPTDWKLRRFKLRWFFKEALRGFLPDAILTKKKQGFGLPYGPWMANDPALRKLAEDSLYGLAERGILQRGYVTELFEKRLPEHPGYYGTMVWVLMVLEQWLRANPGTYLPGHKPA